jgi:S1-C subfamily serine protease
MIADGLALAVPSNAVERFLKGNGQSAFLGVQSQPVAFPRAVAEQTGQESGLLSLSVVEDSPAAKAGLLPGDIILSGGERKLIDGSDLIDLLHDLDPGTPLPLAVLRGGTRLDVTAILGSRPTEPQ